MAFQAYYFYEKSSHHREKKQTGKNIFIMLRCFFLPSGVFVLSFIFNI